MQHALGTAGVDVDEAVATGRFVILDAAETLSSIVVDGSPDPKRVRDLVGGMMTQLGQGDRRIHVFGEMVALLWAAGDRDAAIRLETLWNDLRRSHRFALLCGYPLHGFGEGSDAAGFEGVCACHTRVIPAESYAGLTSRRDRLRAITSLQQKSAIARGRDRPSPPGRKRAVGPGTGIGRLLRERDRRAAEGGA